MRTFLTGLTALSVVALMSCSSAEKKIMFQGQTQGTYYAITYFDAEGRDFQPRVDSILKAFDLSVSMWVPESIISKINRGDSLVQPDDWFIDIFNRSEEIAAKTGGAFDCTVGPLVNAWGFGFKGKMKMDSVLVDSLKRLVDYKTVRLEDGKIVKGILNEELDVCDKPRLVTVTCARTKTVIVYVPGMTGVPHILPQPCSVVGGLLCG